MKSETTNNGHLVDVISKLLMLVKVLLFAILVLLIIIFNEDRIKSAFSGSDDHKMDQSIPQLTAQAPAENSGLSKYWKAPDISAIIDAEKRSEIEYGRDLIVNTSTFLGPHGSVAQITNGMNCQNCHLDAGTRPFGNNYGSVASTYPKFRARSGTIENIDKRVNDCFERSLNGKALDTASREMTAIKAYINFLGSNVEKGAVAEGSGLKKIEFMDRAADPEKGKKVYELNCQSCHQANGEGSLAQDNKEYIYPPLWGPKSYNDGAGLYRIINFAGFVKSNMPLGATHENTLLMDEEAWDVAAYVNSQKRPHKKTTGDWPDVSKKPIDYPFGPYSDKFTEAQHKYGPFKPIEEARKKAI